MKTIFEGRAGRRTALWAGLSILAAAGCARRLAPPLPADPGDGLTGIASWYGPDFHGKATSNHEIYDMNAMTAAHQTLPFETRVRVTNLTNGKTAVVRINDRGPFVDGRIIDLTRAAAEALDMIGPGTAPVRLEILRGPGPAPPLPKYWVQVGAFASETNARDLEARLRGDYRGVYLSRFETETGPLYRVRVKAGDRAAAEAILRRLTRDGYSALILEE